MGSEDREGKGGEGRLTGGGDPGTYLERSCTEFNWCLAGKRFLGVGNLDRKRWGGGRGLVSVYMLWGVIQEGRNIKKNFKREGGCLGSLGG